MTEHKSIIKIYNHTIRENNLTVIAGPCSIESEQQINDIEKQLEKLLKEIKLINKSL